MASLRTQYDTTVYDAAAPPPPPVVTGAAKTNAAPAPPLKVDYGDFVTTPPLGTSNPNAPLSPTTPPKVPAPTTPPVVTTPPSTTPTTKPPLDIKDPASVDLYLAFMGAQPGVNPSVKNDPNYWRQKLLSGELGGDEAYISGRMFQAEGAPTSGGGGVNFGDLSNFGNLFDDPAAASLMQILQQRIGQLSTPIHDPNADILTQQIQQAMAHLNTVQNQPLAPVPQQQPIPELPDLGPQFDALIKQMQASTASTTGPTAKYQGILDKLVEELSQPAYTNDQLAQLKTAAVDTLNHEHQQALDNKVRAMGMQGIPPSSGIAQEALKNVDEQYQGLKAQALQAQNVAEIAAINERRQQLMTAASSSLTAAQQQAKIEQDALVNQINLLMNQQAQNLNVRGQNISQADAARQALLEQRGQDISLRGQDIAGTTAGVTLAQALTDLSRNQRQETNANLNQAVSLAGIPVDLSSQRLNQALAVLGLGSSTTPTNLLSALSTIAGQTGVNNQTNSSNTAALWKTIGDLIAGFGK